MTGIYFDSVTGDWAISVEAAGGVCGYAATAQEAAQRLSEEVARWERYHRAQADTLAAMQNTQQATERQSEAQPRCRHYTAIKACFAVFIARGLPTDDEAMRATLGRLLGRDVPTRKALTAADWETAASAARWLPV